MPYLTEQRAQQLIQEAKRKLEFHQEADGEGRGICSGCGKMRLVVYASCHQWCVECWPAVRVWVTDTQPQYWQDRRRGQETDYGWSPGER